MYYCLRYSKSCKVSPKSVNATIRNNTQSVYSNAGPALGIYSMCTGTWPRNLIGLTNGANILKTVQKSKLLRLENSCLA